MIHHNKYRCAECFSYFDDGQLPSDELFCPLCGGHLENDDLKQPVQSESTGIQSEPISGVINSSSSADNPTQLTIWVTLIVWLFVGIFLNKKNIISWIIYIVVSCILSSWLDKIIVSRQKCPHGVRGGLTRWRCSLCRKEQDDAAAEARRVEDEAKKKEEQRKQEEQEAHDRWKRKFFAEIANNEKALDSLSAEEFEQIILTAYSRLGYKAEATPPSGDKGIDGYLYKDGLKIGLQCKRQTGKVTDPAIRNFLGSLVNAGCSSGYFATTSDFTHVAYETAKANNIKLVNRDDVMNMLVATINVAFVTDGGAIVKFEGQAKLCPRCHSRMYVKYSRFRKRSFWGCSKYPECKYAERY